MPSNPSCSVFANFMFKYLQSAKGIRKGVVELEMSEYSVAEEMEVTVQIGDGRQQNDDSHQTKTRKMGKLET